MDKIKISKENFFSRGGLFQGINPLGKPLEKRNPDEFRQGLMMNALKILDMNEQNNQ